MKHKELTVIGLAAFLAAIFAFILSGAIFGSPKKNIIKVPQVDAINSSFPSPQTDESYKTIFNQNALDPTQLIQIGGSNNNNPFQKTNQH
jgi:hypothetical protein